MKIIRKIKRYLINIPDNLNDEFHRNITRREISSIRFVCWIAGTLYPVFGILDYILFPEIYLDLVIIRAIVVPFVFLILLLTYLVPNLLVKKYTVSFMGILLMQILALGITGMVYFTGGAVSTYYAGLLLVFVTQSVAMPWNFTKSFFNSLGIWFIYLAACLIDHETFRFVLHDEKIPGFIGNNYFILATISINSIWSIIGYNLRKNIFMDSISLGDEKAKVDNLLANILPQVILEELKMEGKVLPQQYREASVLFTDFVGFTELSESMDPESVLIEINSAFEQFDTICDEYGIEKIKTIGDSYMCASGVPIPSNTHSLRIAMAALEMRRYIHMMNKIKNAVGEKYWRIRIGIHSGPVVAGVIGKSKFVYDIWGDAVNTASRMEKYCMPEEINVSRWFAMLVHPYFILSYRGKTNVKGKKGRTPMFQLDRLRPEYSFDMDGVVPNEKFTQIILAKTA